MRALIHRFLPKMTPPPPKITAEEATFFATLLGIVFLLISISAVSIVTLLEV